MQWALAGVLGRATSLPYSKMGGGCRGRSPDGGVSEHVQLLGQDQLDGGDKRLPLHAAAAHDQIGDLDARLSAG